MNAIHLLLIASLTTGLVTPAATSALRHWTRQRDDLMEYRLIHSTLRVDSVISCVSCATVKYDSTTAHAVSFDEATGNCSVFQCTRGHSGCRKCRNANNSTLPQLWVRHLSGEKNCWTTFQHRVDSSVSFNRNWNQYVDGFGDGEDLNYWMGLEKLHQLTNNCGGHVSCRIRWEFSDWNGTWYWAENVDFSVANSGDKYRLRMGSLDTDRSSVGQAPLDHVWSPHNRQFSTPDSDNDGATGGHCAQIFSAGWWFGHCAGINPNGKYYTPPSALSGASVAMYYFYSGSPYPLDNYYSMRSFELMALIG